MPRRIPASAKQRKAKLQLKRAVKRGDAAPPAQSSSNKKKHVRRKIGPTGLLLGSGGPSVAAQSTRKLQSAFVKLPPDFLEKTRDIAAALALPRPIDPIVAILPDLKSELELSCPRRPKWRFDMSKLEVEKNEEGVFKKWLEQTDDFVEDWVIQGLADDLVLPRSPTHFERNIEVWRQLWRVTEISQILLVLIDARCPLLHFPPALAAYLSGARLILVLTKVDIVGPRRAAAWATHLTNRFPGMCVVMSEAYTEKEAGETGQGRKMYEPGMPTGFRERLVGAIREVHTELVATVDEKGSDKKTRVKKEVDWEKVMNAGPGGGQAIGGPISHPGDGEDEGEPEFLTVGVIGQPNVGKSSLLNALFGTHKVRASKTPGKTKHFQTLFWTPEVRLVDCPGLVIPNFVPMEMQVLAGILPISRVSAVPACIHHAARLLPLERVFSLSHPSQAEKQAEDKRTWREGQGEKLKERVTEKQERWTAMEVLSAYADKKGWATAKAGRADVHRAGNAMLRALAEGRVKWAFWPPGAEASEVVEEAGEGQEGCGIWIVKGKDGEDVMESEESENEEVGEEEEESGEESDETEEDDDGGEGEDDDDETDEEEVPVKSKGLGRFGALNLDEEDDNGEED